MKIRNIIDGWVWALGIRRRTSAQERMAERRQRICGKCDNAKESRWLELANGGLVEEVKGLYCSKCVCPVVQKSLVEGESCPLGKW